MQRTGRGRGRRRTSNAQQVLVAVDDEALEHFVVAVLSRLEHVVVDQLPHAQLLHTPAPVRVVARCLTCARETDEIYYILGMRERVCRIDSFGELQ